jgi:hypothetical protein
MIFAALSTTTHDLCFSHIADALSTTLSNPGLTSDAPLRPYPDPSCERSESVTYLRGSGDWSIISPGHKHSSPSLSQIRSPNDASHCLHVQMSAFSLNSSLSLSWPVKNSLEVRLFYHYIVACSDRVDVCDSRRHSTREVPKRAAHFPVILNDIIGL